MNILRPSTLLVKPLIVLALLGGLRAGVVASAPAEPVVSLAKGATLEAAVAALQTACGGAVVAEIPQVPRQLRQPLRSAPVPEALKEICRSFDLFWVRREGSLALQRRYTDGREIPEMEIEELADLTADVFRLLQGGAPTLSDRDYGPAKRTFEASLTGEQLRAARGHGLPFADLDAAQRKLWLEVNATHHYMDVNRELGRAARIFAGWRQCRLIPSRFVGKGNVLWLHYPDPLERSGVTGTNFKLLPMEPRNPPKEAVPAGRILPPPIRKLGGAWARKVTLAGGPVTLAQVAAALSEASGANVRVPQHTKNRRIVVAAADASAADLGGAVECLWNWSLQPRLGKEWGLARSRDPRPARSPAELWEKLRAALPPACEHLCEPYPEVTSDSGTRMSWQVGPLLKDIERQAGSVMRPIVVGSLEAGTQKIVANLAFDYQCQSLDDVAYRPQVPAWLQSPESGWFTVAGSVGEAGRGQIGFRARDNQGRIWEWGWGVGSGSGGKPDTGIQRPPGH